MNISIRTQKYKILNEKFRGLTDGENFTKLTVKEWRVMFFQILSVLAIIQTKYPTFRHNDLKANNILIQKIQLIIFKEIQFNVSC